MALRVANECFSGTDTEISVPDTPSKGRKLIDTERNVKSSLKNELNLRETVLRTQSILRVSSPNGEVFYHAATLLNLMYNSCT